MLAQVITLDEIQYLLHFQMTDAGQELVFHAPFTFRAIAQKIAKIEQ